MALEKLVKSIVETWAESFANLLLTSCACQNFSSDISSILFEKKAYPNEALLHQDRIEGLSSLPGHGEHWHDVVMPKDSVGRVNLRDVAEQLLRVDLGEHHVILKVAQAIEEEILDDFEGSNVGHLGFNQFPKSGLL